MFWVYVLENPSGKFYWARLATLSSEYKITTEPIALMVTSRGNFLLFPFSVRRVIKAAFFRVAVLKRDIFS